MSAQADLSRKPTPAGGAPPAALGREATPGPPPCDRKVYSVHEATRVVKSLRLFRLGVAQ